MMAVYRPTSARGGPRGHKIAYLAVILGLLSRDRGLGGLLGRKPLHAGGDGGGHGCWILGEDGQTSKLANSGFIEDDF